MKTLTLPRAILALFVYTMFAMTSCETTAPIDTVDDGDYRNVFTGEFSFTWRYEAVNVGDTSVKTETYVGVIERVGSNMLDIEYRPGISRRMIVDQAGILSEPSSLGEGYTSSGSITTDAMQITVNYSTFNTSSVSRITGARN
jgi:hypothetical protein